MRLRSAVAAGLASSKVVEQGRPPLLVELGKVEQALIVSRPSKIIKSPYVSDVLLVRDIDPSRQGEFQARITELCSNLLPQELNKAATKRAVAEQQTLIQEYIESLSSKRRHLAHAPSLDCAGMVVSGATVWLSPSLSETAKTAFTIQLCEELRENNGGRTIVGYHPSLAEKAFRALIETDENFVREELGVERSSIECVSSQQTFGKSRVDFVLETKDQVFLVEVKNVVGADYMEGQLPAARSLVGIYTVKEGVRSAIFPHGSNTKADLGVVSDRAIKHITELTHLQGTMSGKKKLQSVIVFMVNRSDCEAFRPCHEADMVFAQCLQRAQKSGVLVLAKELKWNVEGGHCTAGKSLPVVFHSTVDSSALDEELLGRVLAYNAEHGNGRRSPNNSSKRGSKRQRK